MADTGTHAAGDERQVRVRVSGLDFALLGIQIVTTLKLVVLVSGAFREQGAKGLQVVRQMFRAQPCRQAPIEKTRGGMRRPVQAVRVGRECFMFRRKMGSQFDHVESSFRKKLKRNVERF